jgi:hypothetical protein
LFAEVRNFLLYDFYNDFGSVNENVFAYSNSLGNERALVIYNNRYAGAHGWIRVSSAFAEKHAGGARTLGQRTLSEAFSVSGDGVQFLAARDTVTGLEHLYSGRELAEKGMRVELGGYQCHVFLDWKHMYDDANHPWRELHQHLGGRGVPSLADAMRDLQLKPVHDALRAFLDPSIVEVLSGKALTEKAGSSDTQSTASGDGHEVNAPEKSEQQRRVLLSRLQTSLESARRLSVAESAEGLGVPDRSHWHGDLEEAVDSFERRIDAIARIPALQSNFSRRWPASACDVLPSGNGKQNSGQWATVLAWSAIHSLGELLDPLEPEQAGARLFDALKLREPMADAFSQFGMEGEERWRAAARVRAVLANVAWAPGARRSAASPYSWLHDPDVAWLINVHEYQGTRYFNKEMYECLLWWMALPALVRIAKRATPDKKAIEKLEHEIESRIDAAARAEYQIMSLFEMGDEEPATLPDIRSLASNE